jgi:hypothetical protein
MSLEYVALNGISLPRFSAGTAILNMFCSYYFIPLEIPMGADQNAELSPTIGENLKVLPLMEEPKINPGTHSNL